MRRWWLLPLGIAIAVLALVALLRGGPTDLPRASGPPPLDDIDDASRERLEQVLREAGSE
ncbi:MAG: hypothetical protein ACQGVC_12895 [Myxococcota bacterium]